MAPKSVATKLPLLLDGVNLQKLQQEVKKWNIEKTGKPYGKPSRRLLHVVEEAGELVRHHRRFVKVKNDKTRTKQANVHWAEMQDAVGDLLLGIAGYCNANKMDMQGCLETAFKVISDRPYVGPYNG